MSKYAKFALAVGLVAAPVLGAVAAKAADPQNGVVGWFLSPGQAPVAVVLSPEEAAQVHAAASVTIPAPVMPFPMMPTAMMPVANDPAFQAMRAMDAAFAQMAAQQDTMMRQIAAQMNAAFAGTPGGAGSQMREVAAGGAPGFCSREMSVTIDAAGRQHVTVRQAGGGCGPMPQMQGLPAAESAAPVAREMPELQPAPAAAPSQRLYKIDDRHVVPAKPLYRG